MTKLSAETSSQSIARWTDALPPAVNSLTAYPRPPVPEPSDNRSQPEKTATDGRPSLSEMTLGLTWFNWLGAAFVVVGLALAALWAHEHGYIPPILRTALAALGCSVVFAVGFRAAISDTPGRRRFGIGIMAVGVCGLYLVPFVAFRIDALMSSSVATGAFAGITAVLAILAARHRCHALAYVGLVGGLAAPLLHGPDGRDIGFVFLYLAPLAIGYIWLQQRMAMRYLDTMMAAGLCGYYALWLLSPSYGGIDAAAIGAAIWLAHVGYGAYLSRREELRTDIDNAIFCAAILGCIGFMWGMPAPSLGTGIALLALLGAHVTLWRARPALLTALLCVAGAMALGLGDLLTSPLHQLLVTGVPLTFAAAAMWPVSKQVRADYRGLAALATGVFALGWLRLGFDAGSLSAVSLALGAATLLWLLAAVLSWRADRDPTAAGSAWIMAVALLCGAALIGLASLSLTAKSMSLGLCITLVVGGLLLVAAGIHTTFEAARRLGLWMLGGSLCKVVFVDIWTWSSGQRIIALMAIGVCLLGASYFYSRYLDRPQSSASDALPV